MVCLTVPCLDPCVKGEEHLDVANTLNNLSILYSHIGEKAKALEYCQKSLDIKVKARTKPVAVHTPVTPPAPVVRLRWIRAPPSPPAPSSHLSA
jgi:hypothetical protein